jgi:hypothetical protein
MSVMSLSAIAAPFGHFLAAAAQVQEPRRGHWPPGAPPLHIPGAGLRAESPAAADIGLFNPDCQPDRFPVMAALVLPFLFAYAVGGAPDYRSV